MRSDGLLDSGRVDVVAGRLDIHEHRSRIQAGDDPGRGEERVRGRDDLIAGTDVESHQGNQERIGSGRDPDSEADAAVLGDAVFEALDFGALDEDLAVKNALNGVENLLLDGFVVCSEIQQRDLHREPSTFSLNVGSSTWLPSRRYRRLQAGHSSTRPSSLSLTPQRQTQPVTRPGLPTTSA